MGNWWSRRRVSATAHCGRARKLMMQATKAALQPASERRPNAKFATKRLDPSRRESIDEKKEEEKKKGRSPAGDTWRERAGRWVCLTQQPPPVSGCVKVEVQSACAPSTHVPTPCSLPLSHLGSPAHLVSVVARRRTAATLRWLPVRCAAAPISLVAQPRRITSTCCRRMVLVPAGPKWTRP